MLAAPIQASPLRNPCDDDAVARETGTAPRRTAAEPPPSAASVANAVRRHAQHQNRGRRDHQHLDRR